MPIISVNLFVKFLREISEHLEYNFLIQANYDSLKGHRAT